MKQEQISKELQEILVQHYKEGYSKGALNIIESLQQSLKLLKREFSNEVTYRLMDEILNDIKEEMKII